MSATPLVDACVINHTNIPYVNAEAARGIEIQLREEIERQKRHTEAVMRTLKDALGIEGGRDCLDQIGILVEAISLVVPKCDHLHHPKKYQHKITEPCPVEELIRKAQKP